MKILLRSTYGLYTLGFCDHDNSGPMRSDAEAGAWGKESARCRLNSLPKFSSGDGFASSRLQRFPRVEGARRGAGGGRFPRGQTDASVQLFQVCFSFLNVELRKAGSWPQAAVRVSRHGRHSISFECGTQELGKLGAGFGRGSSTSFNVELRKAGTGGSDSRMGTAP